MGEQASRLSAEYDVHPNLANPWLAVALGKIRLALRHLLVGRQYRSLILNLLTEPESDQASKIDGS